MTQMQTTILLHYDSNNFLLSAPFTTAVREERTLEKQTALPIHLHTKHIKLTIHRLIYLDSELEKNIKLFVVILNPREKRG